MSHFIDYCEEIDKIRINGHACIAMTAAATLPDICGKAEYGNDTGVGDRYRRWVKEYLHLTPIEVAQTCNTCLRKNGHCRYLYSNCVRVEEACRIGMDSLSEVLYVMRNNAVHEGRIHSEKYYIDEYCSDVKFQVQMYNFSGDKCLYKKPVLNIGVLINALTCSARKYYAKTTDEKRNILDALDIGIVHSDDVHDFRIHVNIL